MRHRLLQWGRAVLLGTALCILLGWHAAHELRPSAQSISWMEGIARSGLHLERFRLQATATLPRMDEEELWERGRQWSATLGVPPAGKLDRDSGAVRYLSQGQVENGSYRLVLYNPARAAHTYAVLERIAPWEDLGTLRQEYDNFTQILSKFGLGSAVYSCLEGYLDGKLIIDAQQTRIRQWLQELSAREVESAVLGHGLSVSAYSSSLPQKVRTGDKWMNLQVASRASAEADVTRVWIGSPLIWVEY